MKLLCSIIASVKKKGEEERGGRRAQAVISRRQGGERKGVQFFTLYYSRMRQV